MTRDKRIKTRADAERCIASIAKYLREHESPLAADDLRVSVQLLASAPAPSAVQQELEAVIAEMTEYEGEIRSEYDRMTAKKLDGWIYRLSRLAHQEGK